MGEAFRFYTDESLEIRTAKMDVEQILLEGITNLDIVLRSYNLELNFLTCGNAAVSVSIP